MELLQYSEKKFAYEKAKAFQKGGGKVIGVLDALIPEELIASFGMLPLRLHGADETNATLARNYRMPQSNPFLNSVLEAALREELQFCSAIICHNRDEDYLRLSDLLKALTDIPVYVVDIPIINREETKKRLVSELKALSQFLAKISGQSAEESEILYSIKLYNQGREWLRRIYEYSKRANISGKELLQLALSASSMPRFLFNNLAEEWYQTIQERKTERTERTKLIVSSDSLDDARYIELIESCGCRVVMNDIDIGSRSFWEPVDETKNVYEALAEHVFSVNLPRFMNWDEQFKQVVSWADEFYADGILDFSLRHDEPRAYRGTAFGKYMKKNGYPFMSFEHEYAFSGEGQLRTRIEAFLEMLSKWREE